MRLFHCRWGHVIPHSPNTQHQTSTFQTRLPTMLSTWTAREARRGCLMSGRACSCQRAWLIETKQGVGACKKEERLCLLKTCALSIETGTQDQDKEDAMFTVLGELPLITINLGNVHLALYLSQLMYLLVAAIVGFVAEFMVGWRLPFGIIGAIIAALVGLWIVPNVVILIIPGSTIPFGIPLFKARFETCLFKALSYLLVYHPFTTRPPS